MRGVHVIALLVALLASVLILVATTTRRPAKTTQLESSGSDANSELSKNTISSEAGYSTFSVTIPPEGNYLDRVDITSTSDMDLMGMKSKMSTAMHMESERTVKDLSQGGASVDTTIKAASFHTAMKGGMIDTDIACDSENPDPATEQDDMQAMLCKPFFDLVGATSHLVIDEEGNVAEASGLGSELVKGMTANIEPSKTGSTDKLSPSNTLAQASRLLKLLPEHPVQENEEWDSSVDMGDMGHFEGTSKFTGFKDYKGVRCAVIESTGSLEIDFGKAGSKLLGDNMGALMKDADIHFTDSSMKATILWDEEHKISRWSETDMKMTMTMKSPVDDESTSTIPMTETVTMTTDIME